MKKFVIALVCLIALAGCGGSGGGVTAPSGSTITIRQQDVTFTDASVGWHTTHYKIVVQNPDGTAMGDAKITISFPFAVPDPHGLVQLYDGNTPKNSPFNAKTDDFGVYDLRFDYRSGVKYFGDLEVVSGSAHAKSTFTMNTE